MSPEIREEIKGYQDVANKIIDTAIRGRFKNKLFESVAKFTDKFGNRQTGTEALEKSIDYGVQKMKNDGLDNVQEETVKIEKSLNWKR